ncbi:sigma-70 family RNA polymerase sigma factor [Brucella pseudogrignonensis]|jgi:RNA polymerase sigma-70 factor (ECF subfamily)|uniref:sigma-70 family RNA polymerase sigma factor n=1 Tax=Brucella TaxID=234 RepID=UPI00178C4925|nr:sigma-70 family RNA polymerase sigma factor [Brucella pseudogrignonensis]MBK0023180.1 sigma-70 family RNA polymerase sigma factor [Ochrobactrum sp. S45]MBK0045450.1 sigma-70 family RNA polymerase sigma factor [Ochrobactrum sp. S46]UKK95187.1 sigma-70 family RNA polymerase sigma factor [Brucella pseudogrignonensis]
MNERTASENQPSLEELMLAVSSRRDVDAFEAIFKHFAPRVKAYMAKLSADTQTAEELMQETMITVWNKADQFDFSKGALSTWIFTIARNQRIDAVRRARRPEFDPTDPAFVPDEEQPADLRIAERQSASQLRAAMADLPKEQCTLLELAYFEESTHSAIAKKLNLPLGTVKSRLRLAFNKLRAALDNSGAH